MQRIGQKPPIDRRLGTLAGASNAAPSPPPAPPAASRLLTEGGDFLATEAGDHLITES